MITRIWILFKKKLLKNTKHVPITNNKIETSIKLTNPGPIVTKKDVKQKQIYHKTFLNQENVLRKELFSKSKTQELDSENVELKELIKKEQENQEKIAIEMLKSVSSIKENSLQARRIIKTDTKVSK